MFWLGSELEFIFSPWSASQALQFQWVGRSARSVFVSSQQGHLPRLHGKDAHFQDLYKSDRNPTEAVKLTALLVEEILVKSPGTEDVEVVGYAPPLASPVSQLSPTSLLHFLELIEYIVRSVGIYGYPTGATAQPCPRQRNIPNAVYVILSIWTTVPFLENKRPQKNKATENHDACRATLLQRLPSRPRWDVDKFRSP